MIPGVVLAGGASSRMGGRPKALLPTGHGDETFLAFSRRHEVEALQALFKAEHGE